VIVKRNRSRNYGIFTGYDSLDCEKVVSGMPFACLCVCVDERAPC
jgi:hypothetical protein